MLCYSDPFTHPFISDKEKEYLRKEVGQLERKSLPPPPFKAILTSPALLSLMCAQVGHNWGILIMITDLPKYMNDVLKFSIKENGLYSSLPYVSMWVVAQMSGCLSDFLINRNYISITNARKIFTAIGNFKLEKFLFFFIYACL